MQGRSDEDRHNKILERDAATVALGKAADAGVTPLRNL